MDSNNLMENEEILYEGKKNIFYIIPSFLLAAIIIAGLEVGLIFFNKVAVEKGWMTEGGWLVYVEIAVRVLLYLPFVLKLIKAILVVVNTKVVLTNKRIFGVTGGLSKITVDAPLSKIDNVSVSSKAMGGIFRYATLKVMTNSAEFNFRAIRKAKEFIVQTIVAVETHETNGRQELADMIAGSIISKSKRN